MGREPRAGPERPPLPRSPSSPSAGAERTTRPGKIGGCNSRRQKRKRGDRRNFGVRSLVRHSERDAKKTRVRGSLGAIDASVSVCASPLPSAHAPRTTQASSSASGSSPLKPAEIDPGDNGDVVGPDDRPPAVDLSKSDRLGPESATWKVYLASLSERFCGFLASWSPHSDREQ